MRLFVGRIRFVIVSIFVCVTGSVVCGGLVVATHICAEHLRCHANSIGQASRQFDGIVFFKRFQRESDEFNADKNAVEVDGFFFCFFFGFTEDSFQLKESGFKFFACAQSINDGANDIAGVVDRFVVQAFRNSHDDFGNVDLDRFVFIFVRVFVHAIGAGSGDFFIGKRQCESVGEGRQDGFHFFSLSAFFRQNGFRGSEQFGDGGFASVTFHKLIHGRFVQVFTVFCRVRKEHGDQIFDRVDGNGVDDSFSGIACSVKRFLFGKRFRVRLYVFDKRFLEQYVRVVFVDEVGEFSFRREFKRQIVEVDDHFGSVRVFFRVSNVIFAKRVDVVDDGRNGIYRETCVNEFVRNVVDRLIFLVHVVFVEAVNVVFGERIAVDQIVDRVGNS